MEEFFKHFFDKGNKILDLEERVAKSAEEAGMEVPDVSTKEFSDALVDYVWKNRSYQMDRYYTGRVLAAQLSAPPLLLGRPFGLFLRVPRLCPAFDLRFDFRDLLQSLFPSFQLRRQVEVFHALGPRRFRPLQQRLDFRP